MKNSFSLSESEKKELKRLSSITNMPCKYYKRLEVIRLLDMGLSAAIISQRLYIRKIIVYDCSKRYQEGGFSNLLEFKNNGKESCLTEHMLKNLEEYIQQQKQEKKSCTPKNMSKWISDNFNIEIGPAWIYKKILMRKKEKQEEAWLA
ncbi:MAG TPA: hypothetical protein VFQ63_03875 [Patescibacteria group bacterium]|nr:hypothetical protein [Patescibacteria group bacterium]